MDYNNNTNINKNVMGWIPINNDVSISQAKYPRLVAYIKQNFQVNKVYWDVVGGVRLVNASGLYPRFIGNHWTGFTTNPDAYSSQCGDKISHAADVCLNKEIKYDNNPAFYYSYEVAYNNVKSLSGDFTGNRSLAFDLKRKYVKIDLTSYSLGGALGRETRPKTIFMNLLIYAGYPQIL